MDDDSDGNGNSQILNTYWKYKTYSHSYLERGCVFLRFIR